MGSVDPGQLGRWYDRHGPVLLLYARSWVGPDAAADVVHEAFLSLLKVRSAPDRPRPWLLRTVRNACISRLRKRRTRRDHVERIGRTRAEWFQADAGELIDAATAAEALDAIDADQREVILLRIWGQLGLERIAEITGTSVSTAWRRYRDGLTELRTRLESPCPSDTTT
jgi:RNA polymerase sigma-70 factor (ECF subfamily)